MKKVKKESKLGPEPIHLRTKELPTITFPDESLLHYSKRIYIKIFREFIQRIYGGLVGVMCIVVLFSGEYP